MSRDVLTVGSTMRIPLLYRGEYSQWSEMFMNYLEEQTDGEAMINSIKNGDQPLPCDALARHMLGFEYGEQDKKAAVLYEYETFKAIKGELLLDTYIRYLQVFNDLKKCGYSKDNCELNFKFLNNLQPEWKQYATMMRQNKNLIDISIDALYNILKQNQGDVNDAMGLKKKTVVVTSDPLALIAEKTKVSKRKEKVVVSLDSEGSDDELKKITTLLAKAFNRKKFYSKPTNNNLRTSSATFSANKKQEFVKSDNKKEDKKAEEKKRNMSKVKCYNCKKKRHFAKDCKKTKVNDYEYYKTKMLLAKKDKDEQVLLAEDHAWMDSNSDSDQEINANMVFMAQIKKVLSDSKKNSSSLEDTITEMTREFDKKITKYHKRLEKANQQCTDFENQNKDLKDKYDVLKNQATTFEVKNNELNEQIKVLIEKNVDFLAQTNALQEQLKVKLVVIDTHAEYLLTGDHSSNLYTIALNEIASNSLNCLLEKASSSQSWLWHQRLSHLNFAIINNLVKNNLVWGLPKMKFEKDHLCSACEQMKIHQKHHKSKTAFASNQTLYLLHMDLCGPIRVESINGKRYVLVGVDDFSR
nr:integrase, catalytic region, zinc finger, CCHC-type, peptidase aspartic, catalytic [Tanacetum cinerariifolium]